MSSATDLVTTAAKAASLLSNAVRQAHHAASRADDRLLELALREPLRQACELDAALYEVLCAVTADHEPD